MVTDAVAVHCLIRHILLADAVLLSFSSSQQTNRRVR